MSVESRYSRQEAFFGAEGQARIAGANVAIVGLGGLGSHVAQQLAYLGVSTFLLVDSDVVSPSNLNRLIGASERDLRAPKVKVARVMIETIHPKAHVTMAERRFVGTEPPPDGFAAVDAVFGCVDDDTPRLDLVRLCSAYALPYIDLASDVAPSGEFGGRVVFARDGERCLSCLGELDQHVLARAQMTEEQRAADDKIYGVERDALLGAGPSVVSVNGVVASLAVTEFLMWVTGLREPHGYLNYRGDRGTVGTRADPERTYCHYCMTLWGTEASGAEGSASN
jgi:molybdopterin/thiamine biosynthesis adenylyltransferase